jgi:hypothetical protein
MFAEAWSVATLTAATSVSVKMARKLMSTESAVAQTCATPVTAVALSRFHNVSIFDIA